MDFSFNEDQIALRDSVSRLLMTEAAPEFLREIWETDGGRSPQLRAKIAEQGLTALSVPAEHGGLGLGDVDWSLMTQELGYYAIPDSLADTAYVAAGALVRLGADHPVSREWLPRVADGSARIALAHPVNPWIADLQGASLMLSAGPDAHSPRLHVVDPGSVSSDRLTSIDASRRIAKREPAHEQGRPILEGAEARALWDEVLDRAALSTAGQLVGLAQRMVDLSVDYVSQRKQFGKPIGSFQAVKHHLADVVTRIEFARPVLYRAALALERQEAHRSLLASHAKLACAEAAWLASRKGIQVHGAMGYTWEVDLQMFMKRAWTLSAAWGDPVFHKARLASGLLDAEAAPLGPGATLAA